MDSLFSFIAKFIGAPARVGAPFALAALVIYALRRAGIEPFAALDGPTYQIIMWAGVIGFCGVVVDLLITFWNGVRWAWAKLQQRYDAWAMRRLHKHEAMKNLEVLPPEFFDALRFLKAHNMKRFPDQANSYLLHAMHKSFLLEINDRLYSYPGITYYEVQDDVWEAIDRFDSNLPVPERPPWVDRV